MPEFTALVNMIVFSNSFMLYALVLFSKAIGTL